MDGSVDILGLSFSDFSALCGLGPGKAGNLRAAYSLAHREGRWEPGLFLSRADAEALSPRFSAGPLEVVSVAAEDGDSGATYKAVLGLRDGKTVECVLIPSPGGKATLCLSSQVGCRMGCAFCETGLSGLSRNLTAGEIVAQAVTARAALGWAFGNVVFMGMGEPLDNFEGLSGSLAALFDQAGLGLAQERVTVCTVGLPDGIARLKALGYRRLGLSVSLNAPDDATRSALMPVNRAFGLESLAASLAAFPSRRNFALGVNYCLIPGVNDGLASAGLDGTFGGAAAGNDAAGGAAAGNAAAGGAAAGVAAFAARVGRAMVNVIPYNPGSRPVGRSPDDDEVEAFVAELRAAGLDARVRSPRGRALMAACGQLGGSSCDGLGPATLGPAGCRSCNP